MKTNLFFSLLVLAQFVAPCPGLSEDGSARRYAEFFGNYAEFMGTDELFLTFCLLERGDVQHELKMTAQQVAILKHAWCATTDEIPGLKELLARYRKRQSDPTLSAAEKQKLGGLRPLI